MDLVEREWAYGRAIPEVAFAERIWLLRERRALSPTVCRMLAEAGSRDLVGKVEALSDAEIAALNAAA